MSNGREAVPMPRWVMVTWHIAAVGSMLLLGWIAWTTGSAQRHSARAEVLSDSAVIELRQLNQFWRDLVAEQRAINARRDSLARAGGR